MIRLNCLTMMLLALLIFSVSAARADAALNFKPSSQFRPTMGALVNDREITIKSKADVSAKRAELIRFIWGAYGFPKTKLPAHVERGAVKPGNLKNLERVDTLHIAMDAGVKGLAHLFIPKYKKQYRLAILHLGHTDNCTFNDNVPGEPDIGMRRTLNALLSEGVMVLGVYMPQVTPEDCRWEHDKLFSIRTVGSPMKFFLEPTLVSLNYIEKNFPQYRDYVMVGLSGGGWTTTVYAAIDPRIRTSIPVAGSLPLYLCYEGYGHDTEQRLDSFYRIAGYPDLYVLGGYGGGRTQIQVLNRHDDCCFGEKQHNAALTGMSFERAVREYEARVCAALKKAGSGSFRVVIDEKAPRHMISENTIRTVILPVLQHSGSSPGRGTR